MQSLTKLCDRVNAYRTKVLQGVNHWCGNLRHHLLCWHAESLMMRDGREVYLACQQCGHRSPGWTIDQKELRRVA